MPYKITVLGTGYVGLVCGVGLADFGNQVICTDIDGDKMDLLSKGFIPIYEPGLEEYLIRNRKEQRLTFEKDVDRAIQNSDIIFIAVGTPSKDDGEVDLAFLQEAVKTIANKSTTPKTVVTKSTVPVGTNRWIEETLKEQNPNIPFSVVSNPEFLREGKAMYDFFHPDKIVIGTDDQKAQKTMQEIYRPLYLLNTPFIFCNYETAELIKYANNAFLATKITFINQIANLCDEIGADVNIIAKAMGMDGRISPKFLHPGPGFGGSCFPKDTRALIKIGEHYDTDMSLVREVVRINEKQRSRMIEKLERLLGSLQGKKICALGIAFKAETDDIRESPAVDIIKILLQKGAQVNLHDPQALENAKKLFENAVNYYEDMYQAMKDCDAIVILTEWNAYRNLALEKAKSLLKQKIIFDTRNVLDPETCHQTGFLYEGVGRR
ncbi:UDP-glucose dehydrogenase family protein [Atribacter laminatus]|uniref:UDP-glucose 6-dehydrogenase n=1 Tax=Atribacter laminatus TaxID=2847778 RepID=A0A7T1AK10_ATRLM|nr:UDP-glucose/GDP-mannose dehydrogenase family protein [Atribacter laminatus]QPM67319.1 UDP-glucose 6-dehydrogenase [Atribacter laminatus]